MNLFYYLNEADNLIKEILTVNCRKQIDEKFLVNTVFALRSIYIFNEFQNVF